MKKPLSFKIRMAVLFLFALLGEVAAGPYFVVIGTFSEEASARKFSLAAMKVFEGVSVKYDGHRKLYHVHVLETSRYQDAEDLRGRLRERSGLSDAWIYLDFAATAQEPQKEEETPSDFVKLELYTGASVLLGSTDNDYLSISKDREHVRKSTTENNNLAFTLRAETFSGNAISATVSLVDGKGRKLSVFKTGEAFALGGRNGKPLTLICQAPGYSPEIKVINPGRRNGTPDRRDKDGVDTVFFRLARLQVDDIALRFENLFHAGTAVLRQDAKDHLGLLVSWSRAEGSWRLVVNSHCNPGGKREIRVPGRGGDPFDLENAVVRPASDKLLTRLRAEVLRDYFASADIDPRRVTVMGWGSLNPLVKVTDTDAALNERVEIALAR